MRFSSKSRALRLTGLAGVLVLLSVAVWAQFGRLPKIPKKVLGRVPSVSALLGPKPAVSTGLKDAKREALFLDDFNPTQFTRMTKLKRTRNGGFQVHPGLYEFNAQSYCLHPGTYEPGSGTSSSSGYIYAPLIGSRAGIVKGILQRAYRHPDISQNRIQFLLWAILARAKFDELRPELRSAAAQLLSPKEIVELQTGGVEKYSQAVLDKAIHKAPKQVRQVLRAEADLRRLATDVNATFEQAERAAVLVGAPPRDKKGRAIPSGRWSLHPKGFFIRYFPSGYEHTRVQIYQPAPFTMRRDTKGRIVSMAWADGYRIEFSYNDDIELLRIRGEKDLRGYAFRSIRFSRPHPKRRGKTQIAEIKDQGWTFVGRASGKGRRKKRGYARPPARVEMAFGFRMASPGETRYENVSGRLEAVGKAKDFIEGAQELRDRVSGNRKPTAEDLTAAFDVGHIKDGLDAGLSGGFGGQVSWMYEHSTRLADGFRYIGCAIAGECALPDGSYMPTSPGQERQSDPQSTELRSVMDDYDFDNVAVSGNWYSQREGVSGRGN